MTTAPTAGSPLRRWSVSPSASSIAGENALSRSGRLRVNQAIPSSVVSTRSVISLLSLPRQDLGSMNRRPSLAAYPTCVLGENVVAPLGGAYPRGEPREAGLAGGR